ncbi:hypothetical protein A2419_03575 [Candidatus Adlerbacteria bacterium RIFOXYC1_FULL_48_26]|uniref:Uncharacterized protein n=1 Tax=Candidatus Adlerbacteria bacterium RIFOXYC1_FULL_48_26 TaxID=1797247 RepID=A0A1F4Y4C1_9BACT|nr:MAG: hypothetical protein A2419_03575 [Candidatus Adlerbacteria bacterium RIFOXYC1_FULL_48_26]OGC93587.1 MAG: hypothetical protein A2389_00895 [Candidatus Adlerbacteria bacterium RIFOXYB1_FULL_48_10]OGC94886.1 MAG: hypothetical protein A2590_01185 [Candidatus Adlerbacteria bacterium RIFOXYD1_FULL_48_8]
MVLGLQKKHWKAVGLIAFGCIAAILIGLGGIAIQSALENSGLIGHYITRRGGVQWSVNYTLRAMLAGQIYVAIGLGICWLLWKKHHWFG